MTKQPDIRYKKFIQVSKTGAWEYNAKESLLWFSEEYFKMLDFNINDFKPFDETAIKRCWMDLLHPDDKETAIDSFKNYVRDSNQELYENYFRLKNASGKYIWILSRGLKILNADKSIEKIIGTHINISELKELEKEKIHYQNQLSHSRKLEALGTMASGIVHDFKNILTVILGNIELAQICKYDPYKLTEFLESIEEATIRGHEMVSQILTFSKSDTTNFKSINLQDIIDEVAKFISPTLPSNISLKTNTIEHAMIHGDSVQMYRVLVNLCTNAVHAMENIGGNLSITLTIKDFKYAYTDKFINLEPGRYLNLSVSDTGIGIEPEYIDKIFEPFFTTKEEEGTGLGLFMTYGIVKAHMGDISLYSKPGSGTTFHLFFPLLDQKPEQEYLRPKLLEGNGERILIIDNEQALAFLMKRMLTDLKYEADTSSLPVKSLEDILANPTKYDLIITDLNMPTLSGIQLIKHLENNNINLPIILCSGLVSAEQNIVPKLKIKDFIRKPYSIMDVAQKVYQALNH